MGLLLLLLWLLLLLLLLLSFVVVVVVVSVVVVVVAAAVVVASRGMAAVAIVSVQFSARRLHSAAGALGRFSVSGVVALDIGSIFRRALWSSSTCLRSWRM